MAEYTTIVSITYQILGESEDMTVSFPVTANTETSVADVWKQLRDQASSEDVEETLTEFGALLIRHLVKNTRDSNER